MKNNILKSNFKIFEDDELEKLINKCSSISTFEDTNNQIYNYYEIKSWCEEYMPKNSDWDIQDNLINVLGDCCFDDDKIYIFKKFPYKFGVVNGNFEIINNFNFIETFDNFPETVNGDFKIERYKGKNLVGSLKEVNGDFIINKSNLNSLLGLPIIKGNIKLNNNYFLNDISILNEFKNDIIINECPVLYEDKTYNNILKTTKIRFIE